MTTQAAVTFTVEGMHCANCGLLIDEVLEDLPGVTSSATDARRNETTVAYDPSVVGTDEMSAAVLDVGYRMVRCEA